MMRSIHRLSMWACLFIAGFVAGFGLRAWTTKPTKPANPAVMLSPEQLSAFRYEAAWYADRADEWKEKWRSTPSSDRGPLLNEAPVIEGYYRRLSAELSRIKNGDIKELLRLEAFHHDEEATRELRFSRRVVDQQSQLLRTQKESDAKTNQPGR